MLYIRADANKSIATGHIMRCLSIASALREEGEDTTFITADTYSEPLIRQRGFETVCINSWWDDMDSETDKMLTLIEEKNINVLLIDSYYVTRSYLEKLRKAATIVYIDDLNRMVYPVDILINYFSYGRIDYESVYRGTDTILWTGGKYVPLRKEFMNRRCAIREDADRILITTGGTDLYNVAYMLAEELLNAKKRCEICVVAGRFSNSADDLMQLANEYPGRIKVYQDVKNMAELMCRCDIAVTAGGTTVFELCACGVPSVCFAFADNQLDLTKILAEEQVMINAGDIRNDVKRGIDRISVACLALLSDFELRNHYSGRMRQMADGYGACRIARRIAGVIAGNNRNDRRVTKE